MHRTSTWLSELNGLMGNVIEFEANGTRLESSCEHESGIQLHAADQSKIRGNLNLEFHYQPHSMY